VHPDIFSGKSGRVGAHGACEWAVGVDRRRRRLYVLLLQTTVPTQDGGTHESGMAQARCCAG